MAHKGWKRGFVSELGGTIALCAAFAAVFYYPGWWDMFIHNMTNVSLPSAHVIAMASFAIAAYTIVALIGWGLERYASAPVVAPVDAFFGALVGAIKALLMFWAVIYVSLFFPLSPDLRADLRRSFIISYLTIPNYRFDDQLRETMPWFARPFVSPVLKRHHL